MSRSRFKRRLTTTMALLLVIAYLGALVVSTAHLSQLYNLFNAGLPYWVSIGLAVALEAVAFLFSIISTSLGKEAGPWAARASTSALLLVWAGNGYAMALAAPTQPLYVTVIASCFVPVCTLMVGKVLGGLFGLLDKLAEEERAALNRTAPASVMPPVEAPPIVPAAAGREHVGHSAETSAIFSSTAAPSAAWQAPLEVRRPPDRQPAAPASAVAPVWIAEQVPLLPALSLAEAVPLPDVLDFPSRSPTVSGGGRVPEPDHTTFLPDASPTEAVPAPDVLGLPGHTPTVSGGGGSTGDSSPIPSGEPQSDPSEPGEQKAQETPKEVTGLQDRTDEALDRVRLSREELERLAGMLTVDRKAKVKAEQRVLALKYSQAGVAVTHLAKELGCDESTLRATLKQTIAALPTAGEGT